LQKERWVSQHAGKQRTALTNGMQKQPARIHRTGIVTASQLNLKSQTRSESEMNQTLETYKQRFKWLAKERDEHQISDATFVEEVLKAWNEVKWE